MKNVKYVTLLSLLALLWVEPALADIELFGKHPIFSAIKENDLDEVKKAIAGGEKADVEDFDGRSPLIYASIIGNADIIDYLAEVPVSIVHKDNLGNSALYYAAERGHVDVVEVLLKKGAMIDTKNRRGITPLMISASQGRNETVQILLKGKADSTLRDYTGRTALMWAEWNRKANIVNILRASGVRE
jgi:ankyrin repeat protein